MKVVIVVVVELNRANVHVDVWPHRVELKSKLGTTTAVATVRVRRVTSLSAGDEKREVVMRRVARASLLSNASPLWIIFLLQRSSYPHKILHKLRIVDS